MSEQEKVSVGIVGASGYGGVQLVKLLLEHGASIDAALDFMKEDDAEYWEKAIKLLESLK